MKEKIKTWIEAEYNVVKNNAFVSTTFSTHVKNELINSAIERCYGIIMFAINNLFDEYNEELGNWWSNEILPKFEELRLTNKP